MQRGEKKEEILTPGKTKSADKKENHSIQLALT